MPWPDTKQDEVTVRINLWTFLFIAFFPPKSTQVANRQGIYPLCVYSDRAAVLFLATPTVRKRTGTPVNGFMVFEVESNAFVRSGDGFDDVFHCKRIIKYADELSRKKLTC